MSRKSVSEQEDESGSSTESVSTEEGSDSDSSLSDQDLDEGGLQQEVLKHIANPTECYDYSAVNKVIEMACDGL